MDVSLFPKKQKWLPALKRGDFFGQNQERFLVNHAAVKTTSCAQKIFFGSMRIKNQETKQQKPTI